MAEMDTVLLIELICIIIDYILATIMLRKTLKVETKVTRTYFTGTTLFFFTHSTCRLLFFLNEIFDRQFQMLFYIGTILGLLGIVFIIEVVESVIYKKSRHFFTYYGLGGIGMMIISIFIEGRFFGLTFIVLVQYLTVPVIAAVIALIYFSYIFKSTDEVRSHFILITIAILLLALSEMGNTSMAHNLFVWAEYVAPLVMLTALILFYISITRYYKE